MNSAFKTKNKNVLGNWKEVNMRNMKPMFMLNVLSILYKVVVTQKITRIVLKQMFFIPCATTNDHRYRLRMNSLDKKLAVSPIHLCPQKVNIFLQNNDWKCSHYVV